MAERVSSTMFQIWPELLLDVVEAHDAGRVRDQVAEAEREAGASTWARVNAWCMMWPRQPVSVMTSE